MSNVYFFTPGTPRFELSLSQNCIGKSKSMAVSAFGMLISPVYIAAQVVIYKIFLFVNVKSVIISSV